MAAKHNFGPASRDEQVVFGASRPGYGEDPPHREAVADWIEEMIGQGIERVCCLLADEQLRAYDDLLRSYENAFGADRVLHAPEEDFQPVESNQFHQRIRPFLQSADDEGEPVVVHCSAGQGRTGHVLALWLATDRGYTLDNALDEVQRVEQVRRRPLEGASRSRLQAILDAAPHG